MKKGLMLTQQGMFQPDICTMAAMRRAVERGMIERERLQGSRYSFAAISRRHALNAVPLP
jgi:hypothetical protein